MAQDTIYRCSQLPTIWVCPESGNPQPGEIVLNLSSDPAECGNVAHRWMAGYVKGVELDQVQLANEHGVDADELRMLCAQGVKAWKELRAKAGIDHALGEVEFAGSATLGDSGITIRGTLDYLQPVERRALIVDYKSGRVDSDFTHQMSGYGRLAVEEYGDEIDGVTIIVVWLRSGEWDITHMDVAQIRSWEEEFIRRARNGRGNFNPGSHCEYCPRSAACPGRREMVRATIADLTVKGVPEIAWTPETRNEMGPAIGEMYGRMKMVEGIAEQFRAAVKADVIEHGPLPIGGGRQLAISEVNKRKLSPTFARPVLAKWLTPEEIDAETTISASGVEAAAVAKAPKGQGAATKRAMAAALEEAGAISINTILQLREGKA